MADFWRGWLSRLPSPSRPTASRLPRGHPSESPLQMKVITPQTSTYQDWNVLIFVSVPSVMIDVVLGPLPLFCHHRLVSRREQIVNAAGSSVVLLDRILSSKFPWQAGDNAGSQTQPVGATWWAHSILQPPALTVLSRKEHSWERETVYILIGQNRDQTH